MSICAERVAFVKAISEGEKEFEHIVICGGAEEKIEDCTPCGYCREFMSEFVDKDFKIILLNENETITQYNITDLLPNAFEI